MVVDETGSPASSTTPCATTPVHGLGLFRGSSRLVRVVPRSSLGPAWVRPASSTQATTTTPEQSNTRAISSELSAHIDRIFMAGAWPRTQSVCAGPVCGRLLAQPTVSSFSENRGAGGPAGRATESSARDIVLEAPGHSSERALFERRTARRTPGCARLRGRSSRPRAGPCDVIRAPYQHTSRRIPHQVPKQAPRGGPCDQVKVVGLGDHAGAMTWRPSQVTPVANLFLAGDRTGDPHAARAVMPRIGRRIGSAPLRTDPGACAGCPARAVCAMPRSRRKPRHGHAVAHAGPGRAEGHPVW